MGGSSKNRRSKKVGAMEEPCIIYLPVSVVARDTVISGTLDVSGHQVPTKLNNDQSILETKNNQSILEKAKCVH